MKGYLLDTNHLAAAVRRNSPLFDRIVLEKTRGVRIGTCVPVLCEVDCGRRRVARPEVYRGALDALLRRIRVWPLTVTTSRHYGEIYEELLRKGRVLSQVDLMLAALCQELDLPLVTTDRDYEALPWLKTADWTR